VDGCCCELSVYEVCCWCATGAKRECIALGFCERCRVAFCLVITLEVAQERLFAMLHNEMNAVDLAMVSGGGEVCCVRVVIGGRAIRHAHRHDMRPDPACLSNEAIPACWTQISNILEKITGRMEGGRKDGRGEGLCYQW
jgi:hypothetical protein